MLTGKWNGETVKALRERLRYTQQEFAVRVGVSVSVISRWENDEQEPSKLAGRELERLARRAGTIVPGGAA